MRFKRSNILIISSLSLLALSGCAHEDLTPRATATFYLEGGVCQNNEEKVWYVYKMPDITETYIADPNELKEGDIFRTGYSLEGWYQTKTVVGEEIIYSNRWDFATDKMTLAGVELYAKWIANIVYSFEVCEKNADGSETSLGKYEVSEDSSFDDYLNYAKKDGFTLIEFTDEAGVVLDDSYKHPGGDESLNIKVYPRYIKGDYALVRTAGDLNRAIGKNIYLMNDLDLDGANFGYSDFSYIFEGNGHTISNFAVKYDNMTVGDLYVGVFGKMKDATVRNVTFTDVSTTIESRNSRTQNIYIGTIAGKMENSKLENVKFTGAYTISARTTRPVEWSVTGYAYSKDSASGADPQTTATCTVTDNR